MKFARQARIFRGPLDPAATASVVMLLVIFMLLCSLLYTPGVLIQLPRGAPLAVTEDPTVVVEVDSGGRCFFGNRPVGEAELKSELKSRAENAALESKKLILVLYADKATSNEILTRLETLAQAAGITEVLIGGQPPVFGTQK